MRSRAFRILVLLVLVAAGVLFFWRPRPKHPVVKAAPVAPLGRTKDGFLMVDAPALRQIVTHLRARAVLVNVWASWCAPCKEDLPMLIALSQKMDPRDLAVLLVSVDDDDGLPLAAEMMSSMGAPKPRFVVKGSLEEFKKEMNPTWPGMIPATFLFDPAGKLRYFWGGPVFENDVAPVLNRYFGGEVVDGEANFALAPGATVGPENQNPKEP